MQEKIPFDPERPKASPNQRAAKSASRNEKADVSDTVANSADDSVKIEAGLHPVQQLEKIRTAEIYVDRISSLAAALDSNPDELGNFGRFELMQELGAGGFAQVYLARDPQLDRLVALKIPHLRRLTSENARQRFDREARAAALLSHPAIVPIFETGTVDFVAYIASEYCDGETLSEWLERQDSTINYSFTASLLATLSEAVQYSHQRGIVHRDLKPANIMLASTDLGEDNLAIAKSAKILDFGLAKTLDDTDQELTYDGDLVGTPAYMAPELAGGKKETTPRSDLYSLGVVLYLLLTKRLPHTGESNLEILRAVESQEPVAPRVIDGSIPRDLEAITMKCLRKNPQDRYESALKLHEDLTNWQQGRPVLARPATMLERTRMWYSREPKFANALLLASGILLLGMAATGWQWNKATSYRRDAERRLAESKRSQVAIAENLTTQARVTVKIFDEYSSISDWMKENPSGDGLGERIQQSFDNVNETDVSEHTEGNWMGLTDAQMDMGAGLSVMMLCRDYWKQNRFEDAIELVMESKDTHRDNRVCVGIYGGTLSYLYGRHEKDRVLLLEAGYSQAEIAEQREQLRLGSLDCLKRASSIGSLWLDREHWGAIYDDEEFRAIVKDSRYPIVFDKMSSRDMINSVTKGFVSRSLSGLFGGSKKKSAAPSETKPTGETSSQTDVEESPD